MSLSFLGFWGVAREDLGAFFMATMIEVICALEAGAGAIYSIAKTFK